MDTMTSFNPARRVGRNPRVAFAIVLLTFFATALLQPRALTAQPLSDDERKMLAEYRRTHSAPAPSVAMTAKTTTNTASPMPRAIPAIAAPQAVAPAPPADFGDVYYATRSGRCYHRTAACKTLTRSQPRRVNLAEATADRLTPCSFCCR